MKVKRSLSRRSLELDFFWPHHHSDDGPLGHRRGLRKAPQRRLDAVPPGTPGEKVSVPNKFCNKARRRLAIESFWGIYLLQTPGMEHRDAIGQLKRLFLVVSDEDRVQLSLCNKILSSARILGRRSASKFEKGSSNKSTRGLAASARASATRCCSRLRRAHEDKRSSNPASPTNCKSSRTRLRLDKLRLTFIFASQWLAKAYSPDEVWPKETFCATVRWGKSA
jgi:hypothetical protein